MYASKQKDSDLVYKEVVLQKLPYPALLGFSLAGTFNILYQSAFTE